MSYNGWTNYQTWVTKQWMENDEGSSRYWQEQAKGATRDHLARQLKSEHLAAITRLAGLSGLFADVLTTALHEVNWDAIANALIEEHGEEKETDDATD